MYDTMWGLYREAPLQEERVRLLQALTQFGDPVLLGETLQRSLTTDVRVHDAVAVLYGVASNHGGRDIAWEFVKSNWPEYHRRYGEGGFALARLVYTASRFTTPERLRDVERFFEEHPTPAAERAVRQTLETIRLNIAWLDVNRKELEAWLPQ